MTFDMSRVLLRCEMLPVWTLLRCLKGDKSRFLVVDSYDNTIRILLLDPDDYLVFIRPSYLKYRCRLEERMVLITLQVCFIMMGCRINGVLFRTVVDMVTGQLTDNRSRFLGLRPPKLFSVMVRGRRTMICSSMAVYGEELKIFTRKFILLPKRKSLVIIEN
ncbi:hypothetical protein ZOSMA_166G00450 [Zostera marina]|uniref:RSE1/DDB1/CPSF1 second beta-propeller domain-containing protein n=1 Tax=Zostera marina TaxID=29655 RepID=A0A0K9PVR6_ZOSMR|nr:hypothetical protein ZOSMA_166G00450 [Zostera marina]